MNPETRAGGRVVQERLLVVRVRSGIGKTGLLAEEGSDRGS